LGKAAETLQKVSHVPQLTILEKKRAIALTRESQRRIAAFDDEQTAMLTFAARGHQEKKLDLDPDRMNTRYAAVLADKQKLTKARDDDREFRIREVLLSFKEQKRVLLERIEHDLALIERSYTTAVDNARAQRNHALRAHELALRGTVQQALQDRLLLAQKLLDQETANGTVPAELKKTARAVVQKGKVEEVCFPKMVRQLGSKKG
jgi:hypothetical protein